MINKFVTMATAVMMCTAAGTYAFAQDSEGNDGKRHMRGASHRMHHDGFGDPARMLEMMTRHLELDDTRSQTIGNILEAAKPDIDALRERVQATRKAMRELDVSDPGYWDKLQTLSTDIGALTSETALLHGRLRADVFAELTPEQRERAAEGRSRMGDRFRHGGGRHAPETDSSESE
ncbi:MAG: periplasmic heavy metal sensor [Proteobacteria bacterium]|nr:periplasmic heavy metal sensor [Pseudomonadota bacterium]